ncbi:universal stress protein [Natronocalculus amylovorans]|uniref:Universal stress protein n=1 Tax=Natronocalculus amylovorans TaxID=2917812 RepID=A0AAE3FW54_9EURY|nr:universal stress protein [Natronocalculus amylovorans]MCL9816078.1 universal stress protein [Natronocalculus amylovorans]
MSYSILIPVDWSPKSRAAIDHVGAHFPDAAITLLYVINPQIEYSRSLSYPGYTTDAEFKSEADKAERVLEMAFERATDAGFTAIAETVKGLPSKEIVQFAENNDIDHIVMGSHGREGLSRFLLGSTAEEVLRRSPAPVTVVR